LAIGRRAALHRAQHRVTGVLQRDVDVGQHAPAARERGDHLVGHCTRVEIEQADPVESLDIVERAEHRVEPYDPVVLPP
jgi:hypothetical protein